MSDPKYHHFHSLFFLDKSKDGKVVAQAPQVLMLSDDEVSALIKVGAF